MENLERMEPSGCLFKIIVSLVKTLVQRSVVLLWLLLLILLCPSYVRLAICLVDYNN